MYKKGKAWVFAGIFATTLAIGTLGTQQAQAATTGENTEPADSNTVPATAEPKTTVTLKNTTPEPTNNDTTTPETDQPAGTPAKIVAPDTGDAKPATDKDDSNNGDANNNNSGNDNIDNNNENTGNHDNNDMSTGAPQPAVKSDSAGSQVTKPVTAKPNTETAPVNTVPASSEKLTTTATPSNSGIAVPASLMLATPTPVTESINDWMPDENLQQLMLTVLQNKYDIYSVDEITKDMVSSLTSFSISIQAQLKNEATYQALIDLKSLKGLEYATNLTYLNLTPNTDSAVKYTGAYQYGNLTDISALKNLDQLTHVDLQMNHISDLSALAGKHLDFLALDYNRITDVSQTQSSVASMGYGGAVISNQVVWMPAITLNAKTTSYTTPSFIIKNLNNENVPIFGVKTSDVGSELDATLASATSTADFENVTPTSVKWTNFSAKSGYLLMEWSDTWFGIPGYPFSGTIVIPYTLSDTVGNVNVNYQNAQGQTLAPQTTLAGTLNSDYNVQNDATVQSVTSKLAAAGYHVVKTEGSATGTYSEDTANVTLIFDQRAVTTTLNSKDDRGNTIAPAQTLTNKAGEAWSVTIPTLTGYTFKEAQKDGQVLPLTDETLTGTATTDGAIDLIYTANAETATVHYVYADGTKAADDATVTGQYGDAIAFPETPKLQGYTASQLTAANYQDSAAANTFTVTYTKIPTTVTPTPDPEPTTTITVTVHYQTSDGTKVADDVIFTGNAGDHYTTTPANVAGYKLVTTPTNATGTLGNSDVVVTYRYAKTAGAADTVVPEAKPAVNPTDTTETTVFADPTREPTTPPLVSGKAAAKVTATAKSVNRTQSTPKTTQQKQADQVLPQTSDTTSTFWSVAVLLGLLSLVGLKWRKRSE